MSDAEKLLVRYRLYHLAKHRAKKHNIPFTITQEHIQIPAHCPVLGMPLRPGKGRAHCGSPTLDRIIPTVGYVPGNVRVISFRANQLKSNGSARELRQVAEDLERLFNEGRYRL